jgi:WD40 repeat protein
MFNRIAAYFLSIVLLIACSAQPQQPTQPATNTPTLIPTLTPSPTSTITPTPIPTLTPTPTPLPMAGPITENVMTRLGKGWVNDLTFSPNGKILSVATSIGVYLYQVETMQLISFLLSNAFVTDTIFIDDKTLVVGAEDGTTTVWNIESTPIVLATLQRNDPVVFLAITNENKILEVESRDMFSPINVIVWDRINNESVNSIMKTLLSRAAFSLEKNIFALQVLTGRIILVDAQKMKYTATICWSCGAFALSQNGELLAAIYGRGDKAKIVLLDTASQKEIPYFKINEPNTMDLEFSPDGKLLASATSNRINLWNVETAELVNTFEGASRMVVFSPDGLLLASVSQDSSLILRDLKSGDVHFIVKGFTPISRAVFQNKYIVSTDNRDTIVLRDISTGEIIRTFSPSEQSSEVIYQAISYTFSPDEKTIASTWRIVKNGNYRAPENVIIFFDINTGEELKSLNGFDPIAFSPDSLMLASGATRDNILVIWDIASGETLPLSLGLVPIIRPRTPYKKSLVFSPDGSMIAILSDKVILRDISTGKRTKTLESGFDPSLHFMFSDNTGALGEFSPDGTILASTWLVATSDNKFRRQPKGVIILWDILSGEKIAMLDGHSNPALDEYSNPITALAFSPDGTLLASGAEDKTIIVWDAKSGSQLKVLQGHSGAINSLSFSSDSTLLYSNSLDGTVIIWNIKQLLP